MNPIFLIDREITFSTKFMDNKNLEFFEVKPESLVTDYGMLIPLGTEGFNILDYLEYGPGGPKMRYQSGQAVLITSNGDIRWLYMKGDWLPEEDLKKDRIYPTPTVEGRLFGTRVFWGNGNRRAFGFVQTVMKSAFLAMEMKESIGDIIKFFEKGMPAPISDWQTFKVDELVAWMKQHRPSKPIPNSWSKNVIEESIVESLSNLSEDVDSMLESAKAEQS